VPFEFVPVAIGHRSMIPQIAFGQRFGCARIERPGSTHNQAFETGNALPHDRDRLDRRSDHSRLDHDDFGSNRSKIMNVTDSNILERDAGGKPLHTFPHPALAYGPGTRDGSIRRALRCAADA
jgi:hypothetical protein